MAEGRPKGEWLTRNRTAIYAALNVFVLLAAVVGAPLHDIDFGRAVYAALLFAVCSLPLLSLTALNGRFFLLAVFMLLYFLFFGALDVQALVIGEEVHPIHDGFLAPAEVLILSGAVLLLGGYFAGVSWGNQGQDTQQPKEWPKQAILLLGIVLWVTGTAAVIYFQIFTMPDKTNASAARGFAAMGPVLTFIVMLGHLLGPLGVLILAYGYARFRGAFWLTLILMVVCTHVVVGFITDIKAEALIGGAIVILVRTLVDNRVPRAWLAGAVAFVVLAFPIFQAYRVEVAGERGLNRLQALRELPKVLEIAFSAREKVSSGRPQQRSQTFVERSSSKWNMETLVQHAGVDTPFLGGTTLVAIPMAFVPRLLAPDKADVSVGQLFSKKILKSTEDTYISISHLGELYWNFGWGGVLIGMPLAGLVLGFVGAKSSLERRMSMTRLLVLMATVQPLCMGFGGTMPISYVIWLRSMAAIGLMHLLFSRAAAPQAAASPIVAGEPRAVPVRAGPGPRFSNMMR
jgi:O-antigen polysaccharide polymerase Wzy